MKIKRIDIYGYGKWVDESFELESPFHLFYGQNEAGKSTLMSFIHSIFFGFPTRHSSASRYEPKDSSRYGGKLTIEDKRFGDVVIERVPGKVTGDVTVTLEDGTVGDDKLLSVLLRDKGRSFFERIHSFDLKGLEAIEQMNSEQINRFFLSIGAFGNETYLSTADQYKAKASQLFKPTGRKPLINEQSVILEKKQQAIIKAKQKNEDYIRLIKETSELEDSLSELKMRKEALREQVSNLVEFTKEIETINEIKELSSDIDNYSQPDLPEDGLFKLKQLNEDSSNFREKIEALQLQQKELQEDYRPSKELILYQSHEEELKSFAKELDHYEALVQQIVIQQQEVSSIANQLTETKIREQLPLHDALPKEWSNSDWEAFKKLKQTSKQLNQSKEELNEAIKALHYRIEMNNDRIDSIEQAMWPLDTFKEIEKRAEENETNEAETSSGLPLLPLAMGVLTLISSALFFVNNQPLFLLIAFISLVTGIIAYKKTEKPIKTTFSSEELKQYYEQKSLRAQWKEVLALNDQLQQEKGNKEKERDDLEPLILLTKEDWDRWKQQMGLPPVLSMEQVEQKQALFYDLRKMQNRRTDLEASMNEHISKLSNRLKQLKSLREQTEADDDPLTQYKKMKEWIKTVEVELDSQREYVKYTESIQRDITHYVKQEQASRKEKHALLRSADAMNDEEFFQRYHKQDKIEEKKQRMSMLREKLPEINSEVEALTIDTIQEDLTVKKAEIEEVKSIENQHTRRLMELDILRKEIEDGGTYFDLLQEFENEKSAYQQTVDEWNVLKVAASLIEETLNHAVEDKMPQTIETATTYFRFLTDNHYKQIIMDDHLILVTRQDGKQLDVKELSRGTVEPLYIALRLAFIKHSKDSIQFPIIIDDSFVNMDQTRLERMYQLLMDFDEDQQIIYFSFDQTILSYIASETYTNLNKRLQKLKTI